MRTFTVLGRHRNLLAYAVVIGIVISVAQGRESIYDVGVSILVFGLMGIPLALMYGHGGIISLCQASFAALGGYATSILTVSHGWSAWEALAPSILVPGVIAYLISRPILRLPELSLALTTIALAQLWYGLVALGGDRTGGHVGLYGMPALPFGDEQLGGFLGIAVLVAAAIWAFENYVRSARGRALNAIRIDPILARSVGADVARERALVFGVAAGVAGLAGWYFSLYVGFLSPDSLSFTQSFAVLFMVVIGGRRSSIGPLIGSTVYILAGDLLPGGVAQGVVFGAMLVAVLLLLPDGLASLGGIVRRVRRRPPGSGSAAPRDPAPAKRERAHA
ncbi:branched-chain amino acid ABC transporter permease [Nocardioides sp.]|uniref:branched-chain amino acid ABC transporter permease n=1 Tax=Nocardioides sp. TaxID=35761 RepID=UPI002602B1D8|nr:branched-chain amino acid ABC transporter permease [Nocardioides sp.]MDI6912317.1 branched-chain amino acid ABC transporter permease [Nocardioides sp.]